MDDEKVSALRGIEKQLEALDFHLQALVAVGIMGLISKGWRLKDIKALKEFDKIIRLFLNKPEEKE